MKKGTKALTKIGLLGMLTMTTTAFIEKLIFILAARKRPQQTNLKYYQWKEGTVAYETIGEGRPLLLLHNTCVGASREEWIHNKEAFSNYQVFLVDLPGFGASEKPKITYTAYQYALFINDFISDVIQRPVSIIASSASADFTLKAYQLNPKNMRKLILISPLGLQQSFASPEDNKQRRLLQLPMIGTGIFLNASSKKAIKKHLENDVFFGKEHVTQECIDSYYYAAHMGGESARFSYASVASHFTNTTVEETFKALKIPFLVVWGEDNLLNPLTHMDTIEAIRPDGQYCQFEKTRLLPHYENSQEFNKIAQSFLK